MWIWLNKYGRVEKYLTHGGAPVAGETDFQIFAYFDGLDLEYYDVASIKLRRPDINGSLYPALVMKKTNLTYHYIEGDRESSFVEGQTYTGFLFDFSDFVQNDGTSDDVVVLLDTPGLWEATITLLGSPASLNLSGLICFEVGSSVYNDTTDVDLDQVLNTLILQLQALQKGSTLYIKIADDFVTDATNGTLNATIYTASENGGHSLVYDKTTKNIYKILTTTPDENDNTKVSATYEIFHALGNVVFTDTTQTITGAKTFSVGTDFVGSGEIGLGTKTTIYADGITNVQNNIFYTYYFPAKNGTFALTSDIPSLTNYVTLDTEQTLTGNKTFSGIITSDGGFKIKQSGETYHTTLNARGTNSDKNIYLPPENGVTVLSDDAFSDGSIMVADGDGFKVKAGSTTLTNLVEIANGKTKSYVTDVYNDDDTGNSYLLVGDEVIEEGTIFNSLDNFYTMQVNTAENLGCITTHRYLYCVIVWNILGTISIRVSKTVDLTNFNTGDVLFITRTSVPDLWYGGALEPILSGGSTTYNFYKLETQKIDLTGYIKITNGCIELPNFATADATTPSGTQKFKCINGVLTAVD